MPQHSTAPQFKANLFVFQGNSTVQFFFAFDSIIRCMGMAKGFWKQNTTIPFCVVILPQLLCDRLLWVVKKYMWIFQKWPKNSHSLNDVVLKLLGFISAFCAK